LQVAVGFADCFALDLAFFDGPLLFTDFNPTAEVFAIEELNPIFPGKFGGASRFEQREKRRIRKKRADCALPLFYAHCELECVGN
jgi:hypothetical protein